MELSSLRNKKELPKLTKQNKPAMKNVLYFGKSNFLASILKNLL